MIYENNIFPRGLRVSSVLFIKHKKSLLEAGKKKD